MKILVLSFYYPPDLCAGSFRTAALVKALNNQVGEADSIDVVTTFPNRYSQFKKNAGADEMVGRVHVHRIEMPTHKNGFIDQALAFMIFFYRVLKYVRGKHYDLIFATSSRLFTAALGALVARTKKVPLYLDIRDIFTDTMHSLLSSLTRKIFLPIFLSIERFTVRSAVKINIVSGGFRNYLSKITPNTPLSFFTNGVDDEFLEVSFIAQNAREKKIITYAGNIGQGQGLDRIVPQLASQLGHSWEIRIIGDGGGRIKLENVVSKMGLRNVNIIAPISRDELIQYYRESDFLFLHLNAVPAFEKVLPSKIFEYAATGKPILAGVRGYAKEFLVENVENVMVFEPCDAKDFTEKFAKFKGCFNERKSFNDKFSRTRIMRQMADDIIVCSEPL